MDVLDKFFKKYSYKFPKGYPDMNNEQDVLLLESILGELGINLEEAKTPYKEIIQNILKSSNGKLEIHSNPQRIKNTGDISDEEFKEIISKSLTIPKESIEIILPGDSGNNSSRYNAFKFNYNNKQYNIILTGTTIAGGGIEEKELKYINDLIETKGGSINIILGETLYPNITQAVKVPKNKQADFELIGDTNLFIQHKDATSQQISGIDKIKKAVEEENVLNNTGELEDKEVEKAVKKYPEVEKFVEDIRKKRPNGLEKGDNFSRTISPDLQIKAAYGIGENFGEDKVQAIFFGNIKLEEETLKDGTTAFKMSSPTYFIYPTQLPDDYEIIISVTYRNNRNQQGIKNARFGFYPKKVYTKTIMLEDI
jgi:hypothetical protein